MSKIHEDAYQIAMAGYQNAIIEQEEAFRKAELFDDAASAAQALQNLAEIKGQRENAHQIAVQHAASMRSPQGNAYGLSDDEIEVAKNTHSGGTPEQRIEEYARNKQRYQHARATGAYRDDQGSVRR